MKDRPILFSAPMVRAILAGTKTQTRRALKPQPIYDGRFAGGWKVVGKNGHEAATCSPLIAELCPYGQPGDRLWVRETFVQGFPADPVTGRLIQFDDDGNELPKTTWYRATDAHISWEDDDGWETNVPWKPSIHMPRAASRIALEITGVRVERLQDISEADAVAEGCQPQCENDEDRRHQYTARWAYEVLWDRINGRSSWGANPWVWVVEFKQMEGAAS